MPYTTRRAAKDAIFGLVRPIMETLKDERKLDRVVWDAKPENRPTEATKAWARVTLVHGAGGQANLNGCPASGQRRYNRTAILAVQIFEPSGEGRVLGDEIGERIEQALQGRTDADALTFTNVFTSEAGTDGPWDQSNTTATVEYDLFA